jgi:predicted HAD superfamily phosphohydrolase YqeG
MAFKKLLDENLNWIVFDIDNNLIKYKNFSEFFDFKNTI